MEESNLKDREFKIIVIRMHKELNENYKELRVNYTSMTQIYGTQ